MGAADFSGQPGAIRRRDRQVSPMIWGMRAKLFPPQVESDSRLSGRLCDIFVFFLQLFSPQRILSNPFGHRDESGFLCQQTAYAM